jgi:dTDP-4-dehydrorhamnose 3,5-epimerase-like enzyme
VNAFDPAIGINWPIPKEQAITSAKDDNHPMLKDVIPMEFN